MNKEEKSWVLYDVANSAYILIIVTTLMPIYFRSYICADVESFQATAYWGYAVSAAALIIAFSAPFLGVLADTAGNKKRLFVLFLTAGLGGTVMLIFTTQGAWLMALCIFGVSLIGYSGANLFYDAFLVDVTNEANMDRLSSHGYAWGYIGSTIPFILGIVLLKVFSDSPHKTMVVKAVFLLTALWWLLFSIPMLRNCRQKYAGISTKLTMKSGISNLARTIRTLCTQKAILLFLIAYFFYIDGVGTIIKMAVIYAEGVGLKQSHLLLVVLGIQFIAFPFALIYGKLAAIFKPIPMILTGIVVYMVITFLGFLLPSVEDPDAKLWLFIFIAFLVASSQGGIQALSRSVYGKMIPKEKSGEFFGFYNIFGKFAAICGPFLVGIFSDLTGNSKYGILSILPLFAVGGILLIASSRLSLRPERKL